MRNTPLPEKAMAIVDEVLKLVTEQPHRLAMCREVGTAGSDLTDLLNGFDSTDDEGYGISVNLDPPCGTVGCFAGWVAMHSLMRKGITLAEAAAKVSISSARDIASEVLDVTDEDLSRVYYTCNWPPELRERFSVTDVSIRAQVFKEVINLWKMGDWPE